jgi:hypothetical protein
MSNRPAFRPRVLVGSTSLVVSSQRFAYQALIQASLRRMHRGTQLAIPGHPDTGHTLPKQEHKPVYVD